MKITTNYRVKITGIVLASVLSIHAYADADTESSEHSQAIAERIEPVGQVCVQGDDDCGGEEVADSSSATASAPEAIYDKHCAACHDVGVAGAPTFKELADRVTSNDVEMAVLYEHAINGFNAMPVKGLCMTCTDEEVKTTVDYMVESGEQQE